MKFRKSLHASDSTKRTLQSVVSEEIISTIFYLVYKDRILLLTHSEIKFFYTYTNVRKLVNILNNVLHCYTRLNENISYCTILLILELACT